MKCPYCGEDTAYLYSEDGVRRGTHKVEIRCFGKCQDNQNAECDLIDHEPATVATVHIDVIIKRGTLRRMGDKIE